MGPNIWLSILMPVYNVEPYLAECVNSIMRQVGDDGGVEIIIVDDASTDRSLDVAESLRRQYPQQIKLIFQSSNQGVSAARNRLLNEATGQHIWFVDPDDYVLDGAINALRTIITKSDPDLVLCDYRKSSLTKTRSFYGPTQQLSSDIKQLVGGVFQSRKMYCWLKISRRSLWAHGRSFPEGRIFEDIATTPWLLLQAQNYYYVPSPWIFYRRRAGSIMDSVKRKSENFEERKHLDLAEALGGFKEALYDRLGRLDNMTAYYVSDFCAKEFVKTAVRFRRSNHATRSQASPGLNAIWQLFNNCAPIPFEQLSVEYLKKGRLVRYLLLKYASGLANGTRRTALDATDVTR